MAYKKQDDSLGVLVGSLNGQLLEIKPMLHLIQRDIAAIHKRLSLIDITHARWRAGAAAFFALGTVGGNILAAWCIHLFS